MKKKSNVEYFQTEFSHFISSKKSAFRRQAHPLRSAVANQSRPDVPVTSLFCQTAYAGFTAQNADSAVRSSLTTYRRELRVDPSRTSQGFDRPPFSHISHLAVGCTVLLKCAY
jgi:hypothetical protein